MPDPAPDTFAHLDATIATLEDDAAGLSPAAARGVIERWLNVLAEHPELNNLSTTLGEIRAALADQPIDEPRLGELFDRLAERTSRTAAEATPGVSERLDRLAAALENAGRRFSSPSPLEGYQAPDGPQQPSSHHGPSPANPGRKARSR